MAQDPLREVTLDQAKRYASYWGTFLIPHAHTIITAGSIRRERPTIGDVDIVCIERTTVIDVPNDDMFNPTRKETLRHAYSAVMELAVQQKFKWKGRSADTPPPAPDCKYMWLVTPKCELDLWFASEANLTTRLICRTGSMQHNIWICNRAERMGMKWNPYEGLFKVSAIAEPELIPTPTERDFYAALQMDYVEPVNRELPWLIAKHGE